jgi:hypothetical protein
MRIARLGNASTLRDQFVNRLPDKYKEQAPQVKRGDDGSDYWYVAVHQGCEQRNKYCFDTGNASWSLSEKSRKTWSAEFLVGIV